MRAYVLMTALPPTKGHLNLIRYAQALAGNVVVVVCTQPGEPYVNERIAALHQATYRMGSVTINHLHRPLPQDPNAAPEFWAMWAGFLDLYGIQAGDIVVASEPYGARVAEITKTKFFPFDIGRELYASRATNVRTDPLGNFNMVLPEFQPVLRKTVTLFGAESTGKTTLSKALAADVDGAWFFEYARPYLEAVGTTITPTTMHDIWQGQLALQEFARRYTVDKPFIIQDTDLFSTVGYYELWDKHIPEGIEADALQTKSDLYLITQSDIPFEADPIRYGGDQRESTDQFWINLAERYDLNYHVVQGRSRYQRRSASKTITEDLFLANANIDYEREGQ